MTLGFISLAPLPPPFHSPPMSLVGNSICIKHEATEGKKKTRSNREAKQRRAGWSGGGRVGGGGVKE